MRQGFGVCSSSMVLIAAMFVNSGSAQDFADVQRMSNQVLFVERAAAAERHAAEQRRVKALDRRTEAQSALIEQQASAVQQLGSDLQALREEGQVSQIVQSFDAAIATSQWRLARSLLVDTVSVDLPGQALARSASAPADQLIAFLRQSLSAGGVLPRSAQVAHVIADRATLTSSGFAWRTVGRPRRADEGDFGQFVYSLAKTLDSWKIDGVRFRSAASP